MGIPVMSMEFAMGRAAQKSPVKLYYELEPKGTKWHIHGYVSLFGNALLMMFYTSVTAWMIQYFVYFLTGKFSSVMTNAEVGTVFNDMVSSPWIMLLFVAFVTAIGFFVCSFDMQK